LTEAYADHSRADNSFDDPVRFSADVNVSRSPRWWWIPSAVDWIK